MKKGLLFSLVLAFAVVSGFARTQMGSDPVGYWYDGHGEFYEYWKKAASENTVVRIGLTPPTLTAEQVQVFDEIWGSFEFGNNNAFYYSNKSFYLYATFSNSNDNLNPGEKSFNLQGSNGYADALAYWDVLVTHAWQNKNQDMYIYNSEKEYKDSINAAAGWYRYCFIGTIEGKIEDCNEPGYASSFYTTLEIMYTMFTKKGRTILAFSNDKNSIKAFPKNFKVYEIQSTGELNKSCDYLHKLEKKMK